MIGLSLLLALAASAPHTPAMPSLSRPIVIAHRGASGERPEHTLAAYELAIAEGADVIEPDLVLTKDDVFVARHENEISETTDVAAHPEFAARRTTKTIDGERKTGWFTEDFTIAELKTLRAKERLPQLRPANTEYDGQFAVPTLAEVIALAKAHHVAIYPETKHPTYFAGIGHPMEPRLVRQLAAAGWTTADAPVFIQSFEVDNLKRLHTLTGIRLIQLMDTSGGPADGAVPSYAAMTTADGLKRVAAYAWGIGPNKDMVDAAFVARAHAANLRVHPWTFRAENWFLPLKLKSGIDPRKHGRVAEAMRQQFDDGVDGFFTDFPAIGVAARDAFLRQ